MRLDPNWPLSIRLALVAVPWLAAAWAFATGWVGWGMLAGLIGAFIFARLFLRPPG